MKSSKLSRAIAFLLLSLCLSGADCGGEPPPLSDPTVTDPAREPKCSKTSDSYTQVSGGFSVIVDGKTVGPWRVGISVVPHAEGAHDLWFSACVMEGGGLEAWRLASITYLKAPVVKGSPIKLPVPASGPPGFAGAMLDVLGNREHHFLIHGAGEIEVQEFDPEARHFVAQGEVYPEQGGTVTLSWDVTW